MSDVDQSSGIGYRSQKRLLEISLIACVLVTSGCSSWFADSGRFRSRSQDYQRAEQLKQPIPVNQRSWRVDPAYPIPKTKPGKLFTEVPRAQLFYIELEPGAIVYYGPRVAGGIWLSELYDRNTVLDSLNKFWQERNISLSNLGEDELPGPVGAKLANSRVALFATPWLSNKELAYKKQGFWRSIFARGPGEHQYVVVVQPAALATIEGAVLNSELSRYPVVVNWWHRTSDDKTWRSDAFGDQVLNGEVTNWLDQLQQTLTQQQQATGKVALTLDRDGNNLPYLAIDARFATVWEQLLKAVPSRQWQITDLNRSDGRIYLKRKRDRSLKRQKVDEFMLKLEENAQGLTLSVEQAEDQLAKRAVAEYVLETIRDQLKRKNRGKYE